MLSAERWTDQTVDDVAGLIGESGFGEEAFHMVQRLEELRLGRGLPAGGLGGSWGGRVFDKEREVRWLRAGAGYTVWHLKEGSGEAVRAIQRRYYLLGEWKDGARRETHLPTDLGRQYEGWRIADTGGTGRWYVMVEEYLASALNAAKLAVGEMERRLNEPRIVAHRLVGVGIGQDNDVNGRLEYGK